MAPPSTSVFSVQWIAALPIAAALFAWTPAAASESSGKPFPAANRPTVIYSHGTTRPQYLEDCGGAYNRVPDSLERLAKDGLVAILFLCSQAVDGNEQGSYIYNRAREIETAVDRLLSQGVAASNIFLAGHSAGAWSSLMFMSRSAEKVNAAILFAPACCGPRSEIDQYPVWRRSIRPRQAAEISKGKAIHAVVFGYTDDAFNRPRELQFLVDAFPQSLRLIPVGCGNGHLTHLKDCQLDSTVRTIGDYISHRIAQPERN